MMNLVTNPSEFLILGHVLSACRRQWMLSKNTGLDRNEKLELIGLKGQQEQDSFAGAKCKGSGSLAWRAKSLRKLRLELTVNVIL